ncbi:MAG: hypothetical protein EAZ11_05025 [Curvibacter sp.]|nr:MAG: hypothetical protein EAZ11_05025 [Curvibacter sp.]
MKKFVLITVGLLSALPSFAYTWAVIHMDGERPNRMVYFANMDIIASRDDPMERFEVFKKVQAQKVPYDQWDARIEAMYKRREVQVYQVLENPDGPFVRDLTLLFDCPANTVTVRSNLQVYHHNGRNDHGPTGGPHPVASAWLKQARRVGCEEASWQTAVKADRARGGNSQAELVKLGMFLALDGVVYWEHYDFAFGKFWKDGAQRQLSSDKSPEQVEQLRKEIIAKNEQAGKSIGATVAKVEAQIQGEDAERAFINAVTATFAKKSDIKRRTMSPQVGWTESELVAFWGVPQQVSELAGARVLVYRNESDERQTQNTVDMRSGQVVNSSTTGQLRKCELSLFLKPGGKVPGLRLVDFNMGGENCNIDTLGKNRPK